MFRSCTISLNRLSTPEKEVHVQLTAHPFSAPAPLLAADQKKKGAGLYRRRQRKRKIGPLVAAGENSLGASVVMFSTISC